jgi:hypothetical protein
MLKKMLATVLGILKVASLSKDETGKSVLTAEQRTALVEAYGEKFVLKFESDLAKEENIQTESTDNTAELESIKSKLAVAEEKAKNLQGIVDTLAEQPIEDAPIATSPLGKRVNLIGVAPKLVSHPFFQAARAVGERNLNKATRLMATINVADLIKDDYFQNYITQGVIPFVQDLSFGFVTEKYMTTVLAATEYKGVKPSISSVSQQFVGLWTPSGATKFAPLTNPNRRHKINVPITPSDLEGWLMYMYREDLTPDQMPITKYIVSELIKKQLMNDIELKMIGQGKYAALSPSVKEGDAGQAPEYSVDGFCTILEDLYDAGDTDVNWVDINTITSSNAETELRKFVAAMVNSPYAKTPMNLFVSPETELNYVENIVKNNRNGIKDTDVTRSLYGSNLTLVGLPSMIGSKTVFATPKQNFLRLKHINNPDILRMESRRYDVEVFGEYWLAPGFNNKSEIWAAAVGSDSGSGSAS